MTGQRKMTIFCFHSFSFDAQIVLIFSAVNLALLMAPPHKAHVGFLQLTAILFQVRPPIQVVPGFSAFPLHHGIKRSKAFFFHSEISPEADGCGLNCAGFSRAVLFQWF